MDSLEEKRQSCRQKLKQHVRERERRVKISRETNYGKKEEFS